MVLTQLNFIWIIYWTDLMCLHYLSIGCLVCLHYLSIGCLVCLHYLGIGCLVSNCIKLATTPVTLQGIELHGWLFVIIFCNQGTPVILGDFNGALGCLGGDRISSEPKDRGRLIQEFLNFFNLKAVNFDSVCAGLTDTFFSFNGRFSSAIDLIVVPRALISFNTYWL